VNTDGSSIGSPNIAAIGVIFGDHNAEFIGALAENIGYFNALFAEFLSVMFTIEKAYEMHWSKRWIESDSQVVVNAFNSWKVAVPWRIQASWRNCMVIAKSFSVICTHIHREGNYAADALARHGLLLTAAQWWSSVPNFARSFVVGDCLGLPNYRFSCNP
jgi:ribonuclease HI